MLATVWRQLAKNPPPPVIASVSRQNAVALFVLVSFLSAVPGSVTPDETGELGTSPQLFPARAGCFLRLRRDRRQRPFDFRFGCFALDRPGRSGTYRFGWIQIASIPDPQPQPPLLRFLRRLRRAALPERPLHGRASSLPAILTHRKADLLDFHGDDHLSTTDALVVRPSASGRAGPSGRQRSEEQSSCNLRISA